MPDQSTTPTLLRRFFPTASSCPQCRDGRYVAYSNKGEFSYRRCVACNHEYKVLAAVHEESDGRGGSLFVLVGKV